MKPTNVIKPQAMFLIFLVSSLSVSAVETATYDLSYDLNGNVVRGLGLYHEYDELNRLVRVRDGGPQGPLLESYTYDDQHTRLTKTNHIENETTYYISDEFIETRNATGTYLTVYAYDGETLLGRKDPDGKKYFYHPDHLGSTDLITDSNGNAVEETTYKPYGMVIDGGETSDFLYTRKEKDSTGLYYYGARYYDPFFRHFTQPDVNIPDVYNPQSLNRYAYVLNNPYKYVDPSGDVPLLVTAGIGALVGAGLSATLSAVSQYRSTGSISVSQTLKAAGVGAVGGAVFGATLGLASGSLGLVGAGALAGPASGRSAQLTENILSGSPLTQNLFNPNAIGAEIGLGALGGAGGAILQNALKTGTSSAALSQAERSQLQHGFRHVSDKFKSFDEFTSYSQQIRSQKEVTKFTDVLRGQRDVSGYYDTKRNIISYYDKKTGKYTTSISPSQKQLKYKGLKK